MLRWCLSYYHACCQGCWRVFHEVTGAEEYVGEEACG